MVRHPLPRGVRRLFRLSWRDAGHAAADMDEEVRFHLEMRAAELMARGMSPAESMAEARRRFGDVDELRLATQTASRSTLRRARLREWLGGWWQDVRFAGRQLRKSPAFALTAVLTLALGIGANSAIFSVVHHLVLAPLPYADGNRIVELFRTEGEGRILFSASPQLLDAWRARAHSLEEITTAESREYTIRRGAARERVTGGAMEPNLPGFLGLHPVIGRPFTPEDARPGAAPVVMISYGLWQRMYGGRPDVIGEVMVVDSTPRTIVGVAPAGMTIPFDERTPRTLWTPLATVGAGRDVNVLAFGKLLPGVSADRATRELAAIAATLSSTPGAGAGSGVKAMRAQDIVGASYRRALVLLFGAVGLVLLIACANVANLLLVRACGRQREFAVRAALGAGRGRLARQLLSESVLLAVVGGSIGLLLAWGSLHAFLALRPAGLEELDGVRIERAVLLWTTLVSVATGVLFGLGPALFVGGRARGEWLKSGTRTTGGSAGARRMRGALVVGELALSVVLLVSAGLLLRSFRALEHVDLGFDPRGLSSVRVTLPADMPKEQRNAIFADLLQRVRALPGVQGAVVSGGDVPPLMGVSAAPLQIEGRDPNEPSRVQVTGFASVQPGYFDLAHIRLRGRTFTGDSSGRVPGPSDEVIVNENLARRLWQDGHALGRRMRWGVKSPWMTVVGIAQNVVAPGQHGDPFDLQFYVPAMAMFPSINILFRSQSPIDALLPALRRIVAETSPALELMETTSAETELGSLLAGPRFAMSLVGVFACLALLLSAVGLYGVIAYAVGQRTREIGVRIALGARPRDVASLVARDGAILCVTGLVVGIGGAFLTGRAIRGFLYGIGSSDPMTYAAIAVILGSVGLLASYLPARRAMRVDPVVTLAAE